MMILTCNDQLQQSLLKPQTLLISNQAGRKVAAPTLCLPEVLQERCKKMFFDSFTGKYEWIQELTQKRSSDSTHACETEAEAQHPALANAHVLFPHGEASFGLQSDCPHLLTCKNVYTVISHACKILNHVHFTRGPLSVIAFSHKL